MSDTTNYCELCEGHTKRIAKLEAAIKIATMDACAKIAELEAQLSGFEGQNGDHLSRLQALISPEDWDKSAAFFRNTANYWPGFEDFVENMETRVNSDLAKSKGMSYVENPGGLLRDLVREWQNRGMNDEQNRPSD